MRVFGHSVRELWLASEWARRFPNAVAAAGMVAARAGHVFYIERILAPGIALAYDPNSGKHATRLHVRKLAGYTVVDPHGAQVARASARWRHSTRSAVVKYATALPRPTW